MKGTPVRHYYLIVSTLVKRMDKRERVLCMGYLVKSPTKNKEKANFSRFWKLRWCVFVEVIYTIGGREDIKLVLYYYKDKNSHHNDESAKGRYLITFKLSVLKFEFELILCKNRPIWSSRFNCLKSSMRFKGQRLLC